MQEPNLLILDEPTNDLDIVTLNILEEYLKEFQGSLLIVSHDRHFLDRVTDHLLVFCGDGVVKDFIGSFSEYRAYIRDHEAAQRRALASARPGVPASRRPSSLSADAETGFGGTNPAAAEPSPSGSTAAASTTPTRSARPRKLTWKEQKELEAIETELPKLEAEKTELEAKMSSGTLPYAELQAASERIQTLMNEISQREERWLELSD
jgi:ATP-binding cassette subfamily F protein uup